MHRNENLMKLVKLFITIFLCSELESTYTEDGAIPFISDYELKNTLNNSHASQDIASYHASIRLKFLDKKHGAGHICSGALIAASVVLTAAECVYSQESGLQRHPAEFKIVLGALNRYQQKQEIAEAFHYQVTHVYVPPTFELRTLKDNLALMMLDRDIPSTHPILRPVAVSKTPYNEINAKNMKVTSWAITKASLPLSQLFVYNVTNTKSKHCQNLYRTSQNSICVNFDLASEQFCPADIGAPLVQNKQLIGISSMGQDCGAHSLPVLYTDVSEYREWISKMTGDGTSQNGSVWGSAAFLLFTAYMIKRSHLMKV